MINEEYIIQADEDLQELPEKEFNYYLKDISKVQQTMVSYVMAMGDIFEDEEEYFNKFVFYYTLIHKAYTSRFPYFPTISNKVIDRIEEKDESELSELLDVDEDKQEETIVKWILAHPQKALINFIYNELYGVDEEDFDDIGEELDSQMFFILVTIVNIYEESLVISQKERVKKTKRY